jgi:hypothetical protein
MIIAKRGRNVYYLIITNNQYKSVEIDNVFMNFNLYPSQRDVQNRVCVSDRPFLSNII